MMPCGNITMGCGRGVCAKGVRCLCPTEHFGVDCSISLSKFLGPENYAGYRTCFFLLWLFSTILAGSMVVAMIRNGKIVKVRLHKIGISMIFVASLGRLISIIVSWANEDLSADMTPLYQLVLPVIVSVFIFQIFIWFEAARSLLNDKIIMTMSNGKTKVAVLVGIVLVIFFLTELVHDSFVVDGTHDYSTFVRIWSPILGILVFAISIGFWVCWCIISRSVARMQKSNGNLNPSQHVAVAPFAMSLCGIITLTFALVAMGVDVKVPSSYLLISIPLRLMEYAYCILFLLFMGLPTYKQMWKILRGKVSSFGSSKSEEDKEKQIASLSAEVMPSSSGKTRQDSDTDIRSSLSIV
eukprot:TRINITY_DN987_c0_g1_i1.p1 TRINITY_DN987_c0_g1~~TRINITY_DN987_c0_g1_i1.p1  ORF type:complete len:354 (-),score=37.87 TRINITY_DN987_c0_g1_i1:67-1128(-)